MLLAIVALLIAGCAISPPIQEMSDARQAIAAAKEAGAEQHATATLNQAEEMLATAEQYIQDGVYYFARKNAISAKDKAFEALLTSRAAASSSSGNATGSSD